MRVITLLSGETVLCLCCQGHVRAAHRFSLLLSAVAQNAFWYVCGGGGLYAEVLRQSLPSLHNAPRQGATGTGPTAASVHDPRSLWAALAGALRSTLRWPRPASADMRAAADDLLGQRRHCRAGPNLCLAVKGSPATGQPARRRPARGRLATATRGFKRRGASKRGSSDQHWTEGRRTRPRLGASQGSPKRRVEPQGGAPARELPGVAAVRGRRGKGCSPAVRGRGRTNTPRTGSRLLPLLGREGSPSRREVDQARGRRALHACLLELPQGKPSLADQRCVSLYGSVGPLAEADLSVGCARLVASPKAGHCQPLRPDRPNARHEAQAGWQGAPSPQPTSEVRFVGQACSRRRKQPTRSQATGRYPPYWWA